MLSLPLPGLDPGITTDAPSLPSPARGGGARSIPGSSPGRAMTLGKGNLKVGLMRGRGDRPAVNELDLIHVPGAAGRAAAQRLDGQAQLVAGLERLAGPAV